MSLCPLSLYFFCIWMWLPLYSFLGFSTLLTVPIFS